VTNQPLTGVQLPGLDNDKPQLTFITKVCGGGSCPTVYRTDRDTFLVQGYAVTPETAGVDVPAGEQLVEIPMELLAEAYRAGA
jgi:hypothetical protein